MLKKFASIVEGLSKGGAFLSSLGMALIVAIVVLEIVLRAAFNTSTLVASEYGGYLLVLIISLGLAYTMREDALIRISLVRMALPEAWQRRIDVTVAALSTGICAYALHYSVHMLYDTYTLEITADTISETPLWIPQLVIPFGLSMLLLQLVAYIVRRCSDD